MWRIDHASHPEATTTSKITEDAEVDVSPFISEGGRWLIFARGRGSRRRIWMRDNLGSPEVPLTNSGISTRSPIVDKTGDLVAFEQLDRDGSAIYTQIRRAPAKRICSGCSRPTGWFDTNRGFLFLDGLPSAIKMADPRTGEIRVLLQEIGASLSEADWSPSSEYMLFTETRGDRKKMFAVRVPRHSGQVEGPRIPIPDRGVAPDHPRWSSDGRTVFYLSNSDGFTCIYGQTFSPERGEVTGAPYAVAHFHNQRASIDNVFPPSLNLSVDGDSVY